MSIANFQKGACKIVGTVSAIDEPLVAPMSGRACVYYEIIVERRKGDRWGRLVRETNRQPFFVHDSSGRAFVNPLPGTFALQDTYCQSGSLYDPTPDEDVILKRHRIRQFWFNNHVRYRERVLEYGEKVAVLGHGLLEPDPNRITEARGYRDGALMRVRIGGSARTPTLISSDTSTF